MARNFVTNRRGRRFFAILFKNFKKIFEKGAKSVDKIAGGGKIPLKNLQSKFFKGYPPKRNLLASLVPNHAPPMQKSANLGQISSKIFSFMLLYVLKRIGVV